MTTTDRSYRGSLSKPARDVAWLLQNFNDSVTDVQQTVAVSSDGLLMAMAGSVDRTAADRLAAVVSGLRSLAEGGAQVIGNGGVRQVIVEMHEGYLFVSSISGGSVLGVLTAAGCDLAAVGYEMALLVDRCGPALTPDIVAELKSGLSD
ncbi:MAG: roadblock/LC7 domain-containing protein [Nocardioides sp.]